jgi:Arc/MetJ-type ribon-helix-helix transcriptional regulator
MMSAVQISEHLKQVIDRQVAEGRAANAAEFLEAAVHRYAEQLQAEDDEIAAAATDGLAALEKGDYTTIKSSEDRSAFWERVGSRAKLRLAEMQAAADTDDAKEQQGAPRPPR